MDSFQTPTDTIALVVFGLADTRFGLAAASVREVCLAATMTPLPDAPSVVEGVLDVRGAIVPVFDPRGRFGLPSRAMSVEDHLIIVAVGERLTAIRVDRAIELVHVAASDIQTADPLLASQRYVAGVARLADGLVVIHDLASFLSPAESEQLTAALTTREAT